MMIADIRFKGKIRNIVMSLSLFKKPPVFLVITVLVIALAAVIFIFYVKLIPTQIPPGETGQITRSAKTYFDPAKGTPPNFPPGLPLEKPLDVIDNSQVKITYPSASMVPTANTINLSAGSGEPGRSFLNSEIEVIPAKTNPNNSVQSSADAGQGENPVVYFESTFEYVTNTPIKSSAAAYRGYFKKNSWAIVFDGGQENTHTIRGTKQNQMLSYAYSYNVSSGKNYIKLIHSYPDISPEEKKLIEELRATQK